MATSGVLSFHACHNSGIMIYPLGTSDWSRMGFFGVNGVGDAIQVNNYNSTTCVVNASGVRDTSIWGYLINNKYADASGCYTSGMPREDITNYQDTAHTASGTLLIWFRASGELTVSTYNAKLFSYDNTGAYTDAYDSVTLYGFEINPSGSLISGYDVTQWSSMQSIYQGINFADHSPLTEYQSNQGEHIWYAAISARANAVGILDGFDIVFSFQFA